MGHFRYGVIAGDVNYLHTTGVRDVEQEKFSSDEVIKDLRDQSTEISETS